MAKKAKADDSSAIIEHLEQDSWNDIQAYHIENESMWRNIAILAIVALMAVAVYAMYIVNQDKHKVLVFEKDSTGNLTTLGIATKSFAIDNKMIAHQLANFIIALREVPTDIMVKRQNITLIHDMVDSKLKLVVDQLIVDQYTKAKNLPIMVTINSIKPFQGGNSWEVNWSETLNNQETTNWSTTLTFKRLDSIDPAIQLNNPTGIVITYLHPTQDIK